MRTRDCSSDVCSSALPTPTPPPPAPPAPSRRPRLASQSSCRPRTASLARFETSLMIGEPPPRRKAILRCLTGAAPLWQIGAQDRPFPDSRQSPLVHPLRLRQQIGRAHV